jgi:hypothetical protein
MFLYLLITLTFGLKLKVPSDVRPKKKAEKSRKNLIKTWLYLITSYIFV